VQVRAAVIKLEHEVLGNEVRGAEIAVCVHTCVCCVCVCVCVCVRARDGAVTHAVLWCTAQLFL